MYTTLFRYLCLVHCYSAARSASCRNHLPSIHRNINYCSSSNNNSKYKILRAQMSRRENNNCSNNSFQVSLTNKTTKHMLTVILCKHRKEVIANIYRRSRIKIMLTSLRLIHFTSLSPLPMPKSCTIRV